MTCEPSSSCCMDRLVVAPSIVGASSSACSASTLQRASPSRVIVSSPQLSVRSTSNEVEDAMPDWELETASSPSSPQAPLMPVMPPATRAPKMSPNVPATIAPPSQAIGVQRSSSPRPKPTRMSGQRRHRSPAMPESVNPCWTASGTPPRAMRNTPQFSRLRSMRMAAVYRPRPFGWTRYGRAIRPRSCGRPVRSGRRCRDAGRGRASGRRRCR